MQRFRAYQLWTNRMGTERSGARLGAWRRFIVATASVLIASSGCSPSKRVYDQNSGNGDAGGGSSREPSDASEQATPNVDASPTTGSGEPSGSKPTECEEDASPCPADTDCRTYEAAGCDETGKRVCDFTNVEVDTLCADGAGSCDGEGQCVVPSLALLGDTCERDVECGSGHCTTGEDGETVCCDTACDGACMVCGKDGHCNITPTEDAACGELACPESTACTVYPPSAALCADFGECATHESYCQPEYTTDACGNGGTCNGQGLCCPEPGPERECTKECPCDVGEGVCTNNNQCLTGYVCTEDAKAKLGFPAASCLPAHCVNNLQDEGESSVDCGGGCGCRATYEVVEMKGIPQDTRPEVVAMSGDGSAFALHTIGLVPEVEGIRARMSRDGVITELEDFGKTGLVTAMNSDGSIVAGYLGCGDPPECTRTDRRPFQWVDNQPPKMLINSDASFQAISSNGTIMAGAELTAGSWQALRLNLESGRATSIPGTTRVIGMSTNGQRILAYAVSDASVLWSATEGSIPLNAPARWTSWSGTALSGDGKAFIGEAYIYEQSKYEYFVWKDGVFSELPLLLGSDSGSLKAINTDGSVVVGVNSVSSVYHAVIWDQAKGTRTVIDEVRSRGLELPEDLELDWVWFLSTDGRIVVGPQPVRANSATSAFWRVTLLPDGEWLP